VGASYATLADRHTGRRIALGQKVSNFLKLQV
jgi:hypothetical protein